MWLICSNCIITNSLVFIWPHPVFFPAKSNQSNPGATLSTPWLRVCAWGGGFMCACARVVGCFITDISALAGGALSGLTLKSISIPPRRAAAAAIKQKAAAAANYPGENFHNWIGRQPITAGPRPNRARNKTNRKKKKTKKQAADGFSKEFSDGVSGDVSGRALIRCKAVCPT